MKRSNLPILVSKCPLNVFIDKDELQFGWIRALVSKGSGQIRALVEKEVFAQGTYRTGSAVCAGQRRCRFCCECVADTGPNYGANLSGQCV